MQLLSPHLSLEELTFSSTAVAHGIDNTASPEIVEHLAALAASLEKVRAILGSPLDIVKKIVSYPMIQFDQVIQEGAWVHFSVAPAMRQQVLTAHFVDGVARYQKGVTA